MIDKSIKEIADYLEKHRTGEDGNLDLSGLPLENVVGDVIISRIKVRHSLFVDHAEVGEYIYQWEQRAGNSIEQQYQTAGLSVYQDHQTATRIYQYGQTAEKMYLQDTSGMSKDVDGAWRKKRSLAEKIESLDIDESLKKEIIENLKEETK